MSRPKRYNPGSVSEFDDIRYSLSASEPFSFLRASMFQFPTVYAYPELISIVFI